MVIDSLKTYNLNLTNQQMHKSCQAITPQKRTFSKLPQFDDMNLKELSPMVLTVGSSSYGKIKLEMLHSPIPTSKDLFSQLLASEHKIVPDDYLHNYEILEEESYENIDDIVLRDYLQEQEEQESEGMEASEDYEDDNGVKKRKRKSTAQIRMLKNEFDSESNWSKEKIAEMSEITGLSQSQVYKWWWDQKKKTAKYEKDHNKAAKHKLIRKDYSKRSGQTDPDSFDSDSEQPEDICTKAKMNVRFEEHQATEKKVNKRLTFC